MYNWTNDIPQGHKKIFLDVLKSIAPKNPIKVLEVGTYSGTSLIGIIKALQPSQTTGIAIDSWENYNESGEITSKIIENKIEKIFYENIKKSGFENKVSAIKGDSHEILLKLIKEGQEKFDFIYVDGNHTCIHCYTDLVLTWDLLNSGGILAIDDYLWNLNENVLNHPKEAVDYFLDSYNGKYEIMSKLYRVFIKKL